MQLKRVTRPTVKEALAAVRAELGPHALVLSTRLVPASGLRGLVGQRDVEVTAAADAAIGREAARGSEARTAGASHGWDADAARAEARRPSERRGAPGHRAAPPADTPAVPSAEPLVAQLVAAGLDRTLACEVAEALPKKRRRAASLDALRTALSDRLAPIAAGGEAVAPIEVFVGPPGAGKTTTIAKIAAQARARRGARLSLLAADGFRVGAVEQLRLYAEIIGAPFSIARTAHDVDTAVAELRRPMLVDTAGRSPADPTMADLYAVLTDRAGVRTHLVLPATTSPRSAAQVLDRYAAARPSRVVLTRVDEAGSWAPLIPVLRDRGLSISYLGTGQRVPDDLVTVTPDVLAEIVLGGEAVAA
ncbi:MAG: hypothetical protein AB1635_08835 [Acidobacteriota bacterium]